ncbi:MAG: porphobilinogen synthase, partial [Steroidobacteraceae bacterium]|nr:porphobilinogen synthase [Steroidobacteraceae bacterium]MDW8259566.1 delta-aminolevulinic acid dehydratase [Gammaproteobacteria bacterium]
FLDAALREPRPLRGLDDNFAHSADSLLEQVDADLAAGVRHFLLFPIPGVKAARGFRVDFAARSIERLRARCGDAASVWVDTCLCSFTDTGHCCLFDGRGRQDLHATLAELGSLALAYAKAGADGIAPSDMNDGRVAHLRAVLDADDFDLTPIMSYSSKFASHFYGPFRAAARSTPSFGDRSAYQLDVRSRRDALAASQRCAEEGADLLMVKPGMTSLDLLTPIAAATGRPVGAYQVSGEYAALALLDREGLGDFAALLLESWQVLRRAGASFIISYGARRARELGLP